MQQNETTVFSGNTRLWQIAHCKEFAPFSKYIINPRQFRHAMQIYTLRQLQQFYPFDIPTISNALNDMLIRCRNGWKLFHDLGEDVGIYAFTVDEKAPFVLILPGGGYGDVCSFVEGFPLAVYLNKLGYNAFVGQYRVGTQAHYPHPQDDVAKMLRYIREHTELFPVSEEYAACGFSAGGHLAATWGTKALGYARYGITRPDALFLCYPVITMGVMTHKGSRKNLLGSDRKSEVLQNRYSVEKQAAQDYPPTFIWQCREDCVVPVENSLLMVNALRKHNIPYEWMPVDGKAHGWGIGIGTAAEGWVERALAFWKQQK